MELGWNWGHHCKSKENYRVWSSDFNFCPYCGVKK